MRLRNQHPALSHEQPARVQELHKPASPTRNRSNCIAVRPTPCRCRPRPTQRISSLVSVGRGDRHQPAVRSTQRGDRNSDPAESSSTQSTVRFDRHCCIEPSGGGLRVSQGTKHLARHPICPVQAAVTCVTGRFDWSRGPYAIALLHWRINATVPTQQHYGDTPQHDRRQTPNPSIQQSPVRTCHLGRASRLRRRVCPGRTGQP
jgi:hypothetical protein